MPPTQPARNSTQGALSNYKKLPISDLEPAGHGVGRSRGGLTTKIHVAVDGLGRPLACVVTGGQRHDCPVLMDVLGEIRVPRVGAGRPRTRPDAVLADKAYSSKATRESLKARGIEAVIPARSNAQGVSGVFDAERCRGRNVVERHFGWLKQWRGLATRFDKYAVIYRSAVVLCAIVTWLKALGDTP